MTELWLQTLGDLCLRSDPDGSETLIGPSKSLAVLAYVCAVPGREAGRDHVARLLWPEFERSRGRRSLRQALYYLSRQAGRPLVETGDGDLAVPEDGLRVDLWAFEDALQSADFERAVRIYGGPFLDGFSVDGGREFEGWVEARNERIWSGLKAAYHEVVTGALEGDSEKAVRFARQYVELNPLDESAREALIQAHLARGDRVEAYRAYEEHARLLEEELGAEPSESLRRRVEGLEEAIFRWSEEAPFLERGGDESSSVDASDTRERRPAADGRPVVGQLEDTGSGDGRRPGDEGPGRGVRRATWALAGGVAAVLVMAALAVAGWLPFAGVADARSAWNGASGEAEVLVRTDSGTERASLEVENGDARLRSVDLEERDAVPPDRSWRARRMSGPRGPDVHVIDASTGRVEAGIATAADETALAWSPDGRQLLVQAGWLDAETGDYRRRLRVLDRPTGAMTELPVALPAPDHGVEEAAWSPTGLRIALAFESEGGDQDVFVARADGTGIRDVSAHRGWDGHPAWSPDGRWLVFSSRRGRTADLYMTAVDESEPTRLTSGPADELHPRWLTRRHLLYIHRPPGTEDGGTLRLMDVETRRTRALLEGRRVERVYRGLAPGGEPGVRVERVSIRKPEVSLSPGLRTELRAVAVTAAGDTLAPYRVPTRWSVDDTAVAEVEPGSGEIVVRDTGTVRVAVSAGGWRSDTATLRSHPVRLRAADVLLREDWIDGIDADRWDVVGDPEPYVMEVGDDAPPAGQGDAADDGPAAGTGPTRPVEPPARAFVNNGDENYDSGVISSSPFPLDGGVTVEFRARTPFTRELFQGLHLKLYRGERGPTAAGQHRPHWFADVKMSPGAEGPRLKTDEREADLRPVEAPDRWHRYALQIDDDGRMSWVVDGEIRWRSAGPLLDVLPDRARLYIGGRSLETEVQVGPVTVWRGVRYAADGG